MAAACCSRASCICVASAAAAPPSVCMALISEELVEVVLVELEELEEVLYACTDAICARSVSSVFVSPSSWGSYAPTSAARFWTSAS